MTTEFELRPFRWDNLLAFMALLGLMRALDAARPDWRVRAFWRRRGGRGPWVPVVAVEGEAAREELGAEGEGGILRLAEIHDFGALHKDAKITLDEFRDFLELRDESSAVDEPVAAIWAEGRPSIEERKVGEKKKEKIKAIPRTPLIAITGQGHQHFLERISIRDTVAKGVRTPLERRQDGAELVRAALFEDWESQRDPNFGGLRLDPKEDRRYAYQYADPTSRSGKIGTVPGANRLAAVAIPLFPVFPTARGLAATGFGRDDHGRFVTWPIWTVPARLAALRHLFAHPELLAPHPRAIRLRPHGVAELVRARRITVGKFVNFTRGEPLWGTAVPAAP